MVELLIKLYSDKPSRIGIKYVYEYMAQRDYEAYFIAKDGGSYSARLELFRDKVNLILQSDESGSKKCLKALEYKLDQLKRLQAYYDPSMPLEFVHVYPKSNTLLVAKPFKRAEFIRISRLEIISSSAGGFG